jgi:phosphatidate cytidylyltransferase
VVAAAGATMFAVAYLGMMGGFYLAIRRWHSAWVVLAVIIITKMGDTGAYTVGRMIGRHKLIPWLSPGKTWEGLGGAVLFSTLFAMGFAWIAQHTDVSIVHRTVNGQIVAIQQTYSIGGAAIAGVLFALVGHAGDLTVSLFKRDAGLKDSGNIIPGFGGILDVLDSPLLVAPVAYWMLEWTTSR